MPNTAPFNHPGGNYTVTLHGDGSKGTLFLTVVNNILDSAAQWTHPQTGNAVDVSVSWSGSALSWTGHHNQYVGGTYNGSGFNGTYHDIPGAGNGSWTAVQG